MRAHIVAGITLRVVAGAALIAVAWFAAFVGAPAAEPASQASSGQQVTVIATWTGAEEGYFKQVLLPFEDKMHIHVDYTGTRALDQLLASEIQQGNPPDVAILSSPATLLQYQREGYLTELGRVIGTKQLSAFDRPWQEIMTLGTGAPYALPFKVQVHNLVWYDPQNLRVVSPSIAESPPTTWPGLIALEQSITAHGGTPWCVGLDSTPVSGWPATDWIGDILLHQAGTAIYEEWANGELSWTSSPVETAWQTWGKLVGSKQVYGGSLAALVTGWGSAGTPMFGPAPGCYLQHVPSFITVNYKSFGSPGTGYDFFPFPMSGLPDQMRGAANGAWEVSADLLAMFRDTPDAMRLVHYLASEEAQEIWPKISGGGATSALKLPPNTYPDQVARAIAGTVTDHGAKLCFNASDEMPDTLQSAFYQGVMEYLQSPGQLLTILKRLDQVQKTTYDSFPGGHPHFSCGP